MCKFWNYLNNIRNCSQGIYKLILSIHSSRLPVSAFLDYKQDKTINYASVVCDIKKQPVRRSSSTRGKQQLTG